MLGINDIIFIVCVIALVLTITRACVLCLHEREEAQQNEVQYFGGASQEEEEAHFCTIPTCQDPYCVHARWRVTDAFARNSALLHSGCVNIW